MRPVAFLLGSSQLVRFVATGGLMALLARLHNRAQLSPYFLAMAALATVTAIGVWGTDSLSVMTLREEAGERRPIILSTIAVRLLITLGSLVPTLWILSLSLGPGVDFRLWALYITGSAIAQVFEAVDLRRRAMNDSVPIAIRTGVFLVATIARLAFVVSRGVSLPHLLSIGIAESLLGTIVVAAISRNIRPAGRAIEPALVGLYLRRGAPLAASFVAYFVYARFDQFVLGRYGSEGSVASYSLATTVFEFGIVALVSLSQAGFPSLVATFRSEPARFWRNSRSLTDLAVGLSVPLAAGVSVASFAVPLLLGAQYRSVPILTIIQAPSLVFIALASVRSTYFLASGRQRDLLVSVAVSAILSISANIVLVPHFDAYASAAICTVTQFFSLVASNLLSHTGRTFLRFQLDVIRSGRWLRPAALIGDVRRHRQSLELATQ